MPKNLVKGQDVDDVAAYVAAVAGPRKGVSIIAAPAEAAARPAAPPRRARLLPAAAEVAART